jgi:hypothetical protein
MVGVTYKGKVGAKEKLAGRFRFKLNDFFAVGL